MRLTIKYGEAGECKDCGKELPAGRHWALKGATFCARCAKVYLLRGARDRQEGLDDPGPVDLGAA